MVSERKRRRLLSPPLLFSVISRLPTKWIGSPATTSLRRGTWPCSGKAPQHRAVSSHLSVGAWSRSGRPS